MQLEQDTIVAISTPPGRGGIGIVRLSGTGLVELTAPLLRVKGELHAGRVRVGHVLDSEGAVLDQCVATYFRAPRSYTGEEVLELACHGAPVLLEAVLRACIARGARLAGPGEFTQRAFLNGRLDLAQAEAVRDLIDAQTVEQARVAAAQLGGSLARAIGPEKTRLIGLIAALEAGIDFAEDDLELMPAAAILKALAEISGPLERLAGTFAFGRVLREGFTLALVGAPNAGKSSLFNALLERERAIVTAEAGTTRDTLRERLAIGGVPVTLVDTAGLRDTPGGEAEALGIARTREVMAEADLVIVVSCDKAMDNVPGALLVRSKSDLLNTADAQSGTEIRTSAKTGQGIAELRAAIKARLMGAGEGEMITNVRQHGALAAALAALTTAAAAIAHEVPHEMVLLDLYAALAALDELTGATGSEEILGRIFSEFCIGK
jgi:tRNA modification GTPase